MGRCQNRRRAQEAVCGLAALATLAACVKAPGSDGAKCAAHEDCDSHLCGEDGICVACTENAQCRSLACRGGRCDAVVPGGIGYQCQTNSECESGLCDADGICARCGRDSDCDPFRCIDGRCQGVRCQNRDQCPTGYCSDDGVCERCQLDRHCAPGVCRDGRCEASMAQAICQGDSCGTACSSDADCFPGTCAAKLCVYPECGSPWQCESRLCGASGYCAACRQDADCAPWRCVQGTCGDKGSPCADLAVICEGKAGSGAAACRRTVRAGDAKACEAQRIECMAACGGAVPPCETLCWWTCARLQDCEPGFDADRFCGEVYCGAGAVAQTRGALGPEGCVAAVAQRAGLTCDSWKRYFQAGLGEPCGYATLCAPGYGCDPETLHCTDLAVSATACCDCVYDSAGSGEDFTPLAPAWPPARAQCADGLWNRRNSGEYLPTGAVPETCAAKCGSFMPWPVP